MNPLDAHFDRMVASGPVAVEEDTGRRRPIFGVIPIDLVRSRISE